jgi:hypothetical protein
MPMLDSTFQGGMWIIHCLVNYQNGNGFTILRASFVEVRTTSKHAEPQTSRLGRVELTAMQTCAKV